MLPRASENAAAGHMRPAGLYFDHTVLQDAKIFRMWNGAETWLRSAMTSNLVSDLCVLRCHSERVNEEKMNRVVTSLARWKGRMDI